MYTCLVLRPSCCHQSTPPSGNDDATDVWKRLSGLVRSLPLLGHLGRRVFPLKTSGVQQSYKGETRDGGRGRLTETDYERDKHMPSSTPYKFVEVTCVTWVNPYLKGTESLGRGSDLDLGK